MSSNFPSYDTNTFGIDSVNQFSLQVLVPYSLYHYTVTIISPVLPYTEQSVTPKPQVLFQDFLDWCGTYVDIDNENHFLYHLAVKLLDVASEYIDVDLVGEKTYIRAVCLYAGHYLEQHLKMLKDEGYMTSANPEDSSKVKEKEHEILLNSKDDFKQTLSGRMFWSIYGSIARFSGKDNERIWGGF
jgi:hypothetical protein